jgi:hypothetical protein
MSDMSNEFDTAEEFVRHCQKDEKTEEVEYYCWGCKETTTHLSVIGGIEEYHCLTCGTPTFL